MVRLLRFGNYGVYVLREVGERHHLPHAHIKHRGNRVASVFLLTLEFYNVVETALPTDLVDLVREGQEQLLAAWEALNDA
jgi:hypothetical protein